MEADGEQSGALTHLRGGMQTPEKKPWSIQLPSDLRKCSQWADFAVSVLGSVGKLELPDRNAGEDNS